MKIGAFLTNMLSEDSKVSSKRVIVFMAACVFFFYVTPRDVEGKHVSQGLLDVYQWIILGGIGISAGLSGIQAIAGKNKDKTIIEKTTTTNITTDSPQ